MRALLATAIAFAATFASSAAVDPRAGEAEGERIALWPEGKVPGCYQCWFKPPGFTLMFR